MRDLYNAAIPEPGNEGAFWSRTGGGWRHLFGGFSQQGVSIEWHEFQVASDFDWAPSFHPGSLEICLNFSGGARLQAGDVSRDLGAGEFAIYSAQPRQLQAWRRPGSIHRFLTVELSRSFLSEQFLPRSGKLRPSVKRFIEEIMATEPVLESAPLTTPLLSVRGPLLAPPVPAAGRETWYAGKTLEVLAHTLFAADETEELFCHRHQRQNRERVERVCYLLERDLENPPSLEMLAREAGCSSFHLSRLFAEQTQLSIPRFLRMKRIERAAELLKSKRSTVTEAAMAVGYSSLSAFNKAFVEQMGCCPGLYPLAPIPRRRPR